MDEPELYDRLSQYIVPLDKLEAYYYPIRDPDNFQLRKASVGRDRQQHQRREQFADSYTCTRCFKVYEVERNGMPTSTSGACTYHPGRLNYGVYSCCKADRCAGGCTTNPYHVHRGENEMENYRGYFETRHKPEWDPNRHGVYALDCEMCFTIYGFELVKVMVINHKYDVVYERVVKPKNPILDYNTRFTGIGQADLENVKTTLADVQQDLLDLFSSNTILIGHGLDGDMKALKLFHKSFIDTAQLFPHPKGLPFKRALKTLMAEYLGITIQKDEIHDSKEDASGPFRLVMWKAYLD